ncbi:MAG: hypothetical protein IPM38_01265 [Ignavibacteria bacterium]|nr:hypothetical protein [Ignavibacteria bacterium]
MTVRKLTLLFLLLSYSIVLGHSIVPHHHHDKDQIVYYDESHPADDHCHSDDFHLPDIFCKYFHFSDKETFTVTKLSKILNSSKTKIQFNHYKDEISESCNALPFLLIHPIKSNTDFKKILLRYSCLRAPPVS